MIKTVIVIGKLFACSNTIMIFMIKILLGVAFILTMPTSIMACQFDTDCDVGSQCYKPGGGINGFKWNQLYQ